LTLDELSALLALIPAQDWPYVTLVVTVASAAVATFPAPFDPTTWYGKAWAKSRVVISILAIAVGHGKPTPPLPPSK